MGGLGTHISGVNLGMTQNSVLKSPVETKASEKKSLFLDTRSKIPGFHQTAHLAGQGKNMEVSRAQTFVGPNHGTDNCNKNCST